MTTILGISAYYHDAAAAVVVDGEIVAAAQEERFTRVKHDPGFPSHAIEYCLEEAGLKAADVDHVGFYDKPLLKFERLLETYLAYAPAGFGSFVKSMPSWLGEKLHLPRKIRKNLGGWNRRGIVFAEHHQSHAASAFYPSPFDEAAVLTLDGVGEWTTTSFGVGRGNRIELTHEIRFPHSLGLLYSAFTYFTGFKVNSGEYKLMGLAPYGEPTFVELIKKEIVDIKPDGSFRLNMDYFNYCQGLTMTNERFAGLFGGPRRKPEDVLTQREMDMAASVQAVTEEIMLRASEHVHEVTGMKHLCLAGGVALNCVGNGEILRRGPFEDIWIQPASGDAGGALGVALHIWHQILGNERTARKGDSQRGSQLGPAFGAEEITAFLDRIGATYTAFDDDEALVEHVAGLIENQHVVGWFQGRMEFGPRALGNRSILGDARSREMQEVMNLKIKFRESFRPFAPSVLESKVHEWFAMKDEQPSPYMLLVAPVSEDRRVGLNGEMAAAIGLEKLKAARSTVPAITHVDHSARVQTVDPGRNERYTRLLEAFERRTGCPVVINTSFNVRGEPIVCRPEHAYRCFMGTNMDALVLGNVVLMKKDQAGGDRVRDEAYLAQFELD
ncbi:MAG: carbamoyltransferase [Phycisphaeraceae bacterium]|nr:MAG: carbamoyltransferase [Phycisphaeraceae bacterium]